MSELHVGREMDAAVAKALGKTIRQWGDELEDNDLVLFGGNIVRCDPTYESLVAWSPSTSIADAFAALDAVLAKYPGWSWALNYYAHRTVYDLTFQRPHPDRWIWSPGMYDTPAEAICRAILALEATDGH